MFQPQPTPFSPFASYGVGSSIPTFAGFQPAAGELVVDSNGPTLFRDPVFSAINPNANASTNGGALRFNTNYPKMENDLEAQEALAREFQPSLEGPLVGEKKSSHVITEEYAKADPIYVAKTAALPLKYSHYRPILGDGNCGWRATGYAYFETLIKSRNKVQLEEELARMTSLNNLLIRAGGFQEWLFEDMVEETLQLLRDLADSIQGSPQVAEDLLIQRFNNPDASNAIVYHLRLLATSWLKGTPSPYQDFIQGDLGIEGYCKEWLEAPNQEIDHLGIMLLIDVLLKPIGIAVEIIYLDRSEGSQVNSHMFQNEENGVPTNPEGPIIHLLYRPSHYDILYKDMVQPRQTVNIQVNRATSFTHGHSVQSTPQSLHGYSNLDMSALLSIPGFGCAPPSSHHGFPASYAAIEQQPYSGSPISASISPVSSGPSPGATSNLSLSTQFPPQQPTNYSSPALSTPHSAHTTFPTTTQLPIHNHLPQSHPHRPSVSTRSASLSHAPLSAHPSDIPSPGSASSFRPSKYEWAAAADWQEGPVVFQTSTFKNSHYNTAHYNNPNFQPEEWTPECEEAEKNAGRKRSA